MNRYPFPGTVAMNRALRRSFWSFARQVADVTVDDVALGHVVHAPERVQARVARHHVTDSGCLEIAPALVESGKCSSADPARISRCRMSISSSTRRRTGLNRTAFASARRAMTPTITRMRPTAQRHGRPWDAVCIGELAPT